MDLRRALPLKIRCDRRSRINSPETGATARARPISPGIPPKTSPGAIASPAALWEGGIRFRGNRGAIRGLSSRESGRVGAHPNLADPHGIPRGTHRVHPGKCPRGRARAPIQGSAGVGKFANSRAVDFYALNSICGRPKETPWRRNAARHPRKPLVAGQPYLFTGL